MHRSLNKSLNITEPEPVPSTRNTDAQLRLFALEAESNGDYLLAAHYYKQVDLCSDNNYRMSILVFSYSVLHKVRTNFVHGSIMLLFIYLLMT